MERLLNHFASYQNLSIEVQDFLQQHGRVKHYAKSHYYKLSDEHITKWIFIIQGLAAIIYYSHNKEIVERIYTANNYFTGTKHIYSKTSSPVSIQFLRHTIVYEISNSHFQRALILFPELTEIYQILKQHEIAYNHQLIHILKLPPYQRLHALYQVSTELFNLLTIKEKMAYLHFSNYKAYYRALAYHLHR